MLVITFTKQGRRVFVAHQNNIAGSGERRHSDAGSLGAPQARPEVGVKGHHHPCRFGQLNRPRTSGGSPLTQGRRNPRQMQGFNAHKLLGPQIFGAHVGGS